MNWEYCDKLIADMNRRNLRMFDKLTLMPFDELNVLHSVQGVYKKSIELAKKRCLMIAWHSYVDAYMLATGCKRERAEKKADESITEDFIVEMWDEYNPVTLYQFIPEAERKCQRLVEALLASDMKKAEVDKALRLWTRQVAEYADESVVNGTIEAFNDAGVKKVRWIAVKDSRTCTTCDERNGKVYPITHVPSRPHYHCRCRLEIVN